MSSGALQIGSSWRGGNPSFVQQGQVDWVAFGNTIWTASAAILQRFAAAGIQPVTYGTGLGLASQFQLDRLGQWRMEKAVKSLRAVSVLDNLLWIGFGYQSVVRTMGETVAGLKSLALCACLTEVHSEEFSAWVLSELWQVSGFPDEFEPSYTQFLALVKASAGVVSATEFSTVSDTMLGDQIWRQPSDSTSGYENGEVSGFEDGVLAASSAKDLANALHGLFMVSRGEVETIVITGGSECAFLAGLAHWLFNMRIQVHNSQGQSIFKNDEEKPAQVIFQYGELRTKAIQIAHTTYVLGHCRDIFGPIQDSEKSNLIVRTSWDGCLSRVFGTTFQRLCRVSHLLGDYLGGVARIYKAVSCGEPNAGRICRKNFYYYVETSYGYGFIETVLTTFPELQRTDGLRDRMQHIIDFSFDGAMRITEQSVSALKTICNCSDCEYVPHPGDVEIALPTITRRCIVRLTYAIRKIASIMACTVQDPDDPPLLPSVQGILEFSDAGDSLQEAGRNDGEELDKPLEDEGSKSDWKTSSFYFKALGLVEEAKHYSLDYHTLAAATILFQGSQLRGPGMSLRDAKPCTAISRRGVCCFIDAIRSISCQADMLCRIHVIAGHIQYKNRSYESVFDGNLLWDKAWTIAERALIAAEKEPAQTEESLDSIPDAIITVPDITKIQALAAEASSGSTIVCYYRVFTSKSSVLVPPGKITECVLDRTGLIICNGQGCNRRLAFPCSVVRGGWQVPVDHQPNLTFSSRLGCCLWTYQDDVARCLVMMSHHRLSESTQHFVYLRRQECLPCCTSSILLDSATMFRTPILNPKSYHNAVAHII